MMTWKLASVPHLVQLTVVSRYVEASSVFIDENGHEHKLSINQGVFENMEKLRALSLTFHIILVACSNIPLLIRSLNSVRNHMLKDTVILIDGAIGVAFETLVHEIVPDQYVLSFFWDNDVKILPNSQFRCFRASKEIYIGYTSFKRHGVFDHTQRRSAAQSYLMNKESLIMDTVNILRLCQTNLKVHICPDHEKCYPMICSIWRKCIVNICFDIMSVAFEEFDHGVLKYKPSFRPLITGLLNEILQIVRLSGIKDFPSLLGTSKDFFDLYLSRNPKKSPFSEMRPPFAEYPILIYNAYHNYEDYSLVMLFQMLLISDGLDSSNNSLSFLYMTYLRLTRLQNNSLFLKRPQNMRTEGQRSNPSEHRSTLLIEPNEVESTNNDSYISASEFDNAEDDNSRVTEGIELFWSLQKSLEGETVALDSKTSPASSANILVRDTQLSASIGKNPTKDEFEEYSRPFWAYKFKSRRILERGAISPSSEDIASLSGIYFDQDDLLGPVSLLKDESIDADRCAEDGHRYKLFDSIRRPLLIRSKDRVMNSSRQQRQNPLEYQKNSETRKTIMEAANIGGFLNTTTDRYSYVDSNNPTSS